MLVDLKGAADKRLAALLLGKSYVKNSDELPGAGGSFPAGRYVMAQDGSNHVFLISQPLSEVQTKPQQWLNRDFIKAENPKRISVAGTTPAMNWTVTREDATAAWTLADVKPGEEFDPAKVSALASLFTSMAFDEVLAPDAPLTETGLDKPASIQVETFDGFVYEFRVGKLTSDNYPVLVSVKADLPKERIPAADEKPEDKAKLDQDFQTRQAQLSEKLSKEQKLAGRPYLIAKSTIEQLLKDRSSLMAEKKPSPTPPPATTASSPVPSASPRKPRK
jgi:hypothetical protein